MTDIENEKAFASEEYSTGNGAEKPDSEGSCLDVVDKAATNVAGVSNVSVDGARSSISFDYDPAVTALADLQQLTDEVAPTLTERWKNCAMRLDPVGGRACESCALALERRLNRLPGVRQASASYIGGMLTLSYDDSLVSEDELLHKVSALGGHPAPVAAITPTPTPSAPLSLPGRLLSAAKSNIELVMVAITLVALITGFIAERTAASNLTSFIAYTIAYATGGYFGLRAGLQSIRLLTIDVDLLMVLAAIGAAAIGAPFEGALLLFLFSLSNVLQKYAFGRTRNAIRALLDLRPQQALVLRSGRLITIPVERVVVGDNVVVRPGEKIPLDGIISEGSSTIDQSSLTGESIPVDRAHGDSVFAGTMNGQGSLEVRVTRTASGSTLARLIKTVEEAQSRKANTQLTIDRFEQYYAAAIVAGTAIAFVAAYLLVDEPASASFYRAISLLVAASPCALVVSTPATVLSAIGNGASRGILFKGGVHVEQCGQVKAIAFDKTGTLTTGKPVVTSLIVTDRDWAGDEDDLLQLAASVESRSEHPLALAILRRADEKGLERLPVEQFQASAGLGVRARVEDNDYLLGNRRFLSSFAPLSHDSVTDGFSRIHEQGSTAIGIAIIGDDEDSMRVLGVIGIADAIRPDAAQNLNELRALGVEHLVMLTGDSEEVARHIAAEAGVDEYYAALMPEDKLRVIGEIQQKYGPTAMVGDGVNDAPALAAATVGIAMGAAGSDVALETADVILMSDQLANIPYAIALGRQTRKRLYQNLALSMTVIAVLIAAVLGLKLALPLSVLGHEGSTILVSLNGLRMLAFGRDR